jgi:hypothetical protein
MEVESVNVRQTLYRVRVYVGDDASEVEYVYFETRAAAERYVKRLPESTR